jgi:hypothetical protein
MRWFVNNDIISLELQNGNAFVPSAKQIYLAEFKGNCSINGITVTKRPSQDTDFPWRETFLVKPYQIRFRQITKDTIFVFPERHSYRHQFN